VKKIEISFDIYGVEIKKYNYVIDFHVFDEDENEECMRSK